MQKALSDGGEEDRLVATVERSLETREEASAIDLEGIDLSIGFGMVKKGEISKTFLF